MKWWVYLLAATTSNQTYIGMTNNVKRRLRQHNGELAGGAKYTTAGGPWELRFTYGPYKTRSIACRVEWRAKRFRGAERFKHREWVVNLDDDAEDKDRNLHHYKRRRRRRRR